MKSRIALPALALLLFNARGEDASPQRLYRAEVFTLPRNVAWPLLTSPLDGAALHERMLEAMATGEATLDKLIVLNAGHGARSTVEQTDHFEYPTEFDPPQAVPTLALVDPDLGAPDKPVESPATEHISPFNAGLGTLTTTTATAFEMRQLGDTLQIEGIGDGRVGYKLTSVELLAVEQIGDIPQPVFAPRILDGSARVVSGRPAFLGTFSHAGKSGVKGQSESETISLAFLTAKDGMVERPQEQPVIFKHPSLRATFEVLSVEKAVAHALLLETSDEQRLYERAVEQGRRESTLSQRGTPGSRQTIQNADEYISPTEFDPPQISQRLIIASSQLLKDMRAGRQTGLGNPAPMSSVNPNGGFGLITTLSPTAFEMLPLGERIEFEFTEGDDGLQITAAIDFTHLSGTMLYGSIRHPVVETRKLVTSLRAVENRRMLLGTLNKPLGTGFADSNKDDRVWLAFLRFTK